MEDWLKEANSEIELEAQYAFDEIQSLSDRLDIQPEYAVEQFIKYLRKVATKELL